MSVTTSVGNVVAADALYRATASGASTRLAATRDPVTWAASVRSMGESSGRSTTSALTTAWATWPSTGAVSLQYAGWQFRVASCSGTGVPARATTIRTPCSVITIVGSPVFVGNPRPTVSSVKAFFNRLRAASASIGSPKSGKEAYEPAGSGWTMV